MSRLAEQGWVCLAVDYRVAPHHRWPRHIIDVKTAIAWARANVDKFGGDRNFVAIAGMFGRRAPVRAGRADPRRPAVPGEAARRRGHLGGRGRRDLRPLRLGGPLDAGARTVRRIPGARRGEETIARHPEIFRDASPIARVHRNAPPFLVIHGSKDTVIPVEQARSFVERLRAVSHSMVGYLEFPGAGHGYRHHRWRAAGATAHAPSLFLNQIYRTKTRIGAKEVI